MLTIVSLTFFQHHTPSHLAEDLQEVIKQESDDSGIVAEFHETEEPVLKKIKQEVSKKIFMQASMYYTVYCILQNKYESYNTVKP